MNRYVERFPVRCSLPYCLIASMLGGMMPSAAVAATYTWKGPGSGWVTSSNWEGSPSLVWSNTTDAVLYSATNTSFTQNLGTGNKTIRSLALNANADSNLTLYLNNGNSNPTAASDLTFDTDSVSGTASITIDAGAAGSFTIGSVGSFNGNVVLNDHLLVDHNGSGLLSIVRPVTGAFGIVKQGSGTISFGGSQTFSGGLTLNAGGLEFASSSALGTGTFTVNGGAFGATGLSNRTLANPIVFNANVTLSGSNVRTATYTGAVDLGNATRTLTVSQTTNINGTISNGGLTVAGNGSFTLTLGGSNDFTGPTTVTSGTLVLNNANALAGSTFGGGAGSLSFGTLTSATFGGMSGSTNLALQNASSAAVALSVGANGGSTSFSAALSGAGSLVKVGSGTFTFAGTTANGVPTSVSAGKFVANGILGTGSLSVAAAAWLAGTGTVGGAVMVDGILSPGASPGMLTLGSLDLGSTSTTIMELAGTTRGSLYDSIDITAGGIGYGGTLQLDFQQTFADNTSFVLFGILTGTGSRTGSFASVTAVGSYGTLTFTNDGSGVWSSGPTGITDQEIRFAQSTGEVIVVPEPSTTAVIAAGISIAWLCRRRRPRGRPLAGLDGPCCW